jgi:steroid 5-alpha reductase family enzyme
VALALLATLGLSLASALCGWWISVRLRNAALVDIGWGFGFGVLASAAWLLAGEPLTQRSLLVLVLVLAWSVRLGTHLWIRWRGEPHEDFRYRAMREHHGERFARVSLYTVFLLQVGVQWIVALPLLVSILAPGVRPLGWLDAGAAAVALGGIAIEAIADAQLARFRRSRRGPGELLDRGLWRYTRHPNYFGDFLAWWGFFGLALGTPWGWLTLPSPLLLSFLLLRVSGVPMLERGLRTRKPGYAEYAARTNAFFPGPPRRGARSARALG